MMPVNLDAEVSLLACLLSGNVYHGEAADVYAKITPEAFSSSKLGLIYGACRALFDDDPEIVDSEMVSDRLKSHGQLEQVGGATYIAQVEEKASTGATVKHWAAVVDEYARRRATILASTEAIQRAGDATAPIGPTVDMLGERLTQISASREDLKVETLASLVKSEFKAIETAYHAEGEELGVQTGFYELDEMVGGLMGSELTILAGRPAMGKTALALSFAKNAADSGAPTLFFSLEMSKRQLIHRLISMHSGISNQCLRRPKLMARGGMWPKLFAAMDNLHVDKLAIVDSPSATIMDIRAASRMCRAKHGLGLIVVDYLQLIRPVSRGHSREREVADISCGMKSIAKELQVPVVCLAQLNRATEQQKENVPRLSNLRESGSLEQDADIVLLVHRPHYYDETKDASLAEVYVAKHRHGPTGKVDVGWNEHKTLFYNREVRHA